MSGACAAREGRRERAFDLLDEDDSDYVREKITALDSEIALKQTELSRIRAAIKVAEVARPEPKDLQEVIDRLRSSDPDHTARMHAAALIKEQVRLLLVYPDGMRQANDETLAWVVENSDAETREAMRFRFWVRRSILVLGTSVCLSMLRLQFTGNWDGRPRMPHSRLLNAAETISGHPQGSETRRPVGPLRDAIASPNPRSNPLNLPVHRASKYPAIT